MGNNTEKKPMNQSTKTHTKIEKKKRLRATTFSIAQLKELYHIWGTIRKSAMLLSQSWN